MLELRRWSAFARAIMSRYLDIEPSIPSRAEMVLLSPFQEQQPGAEPVRISYRYHYDIHNIHRYLTQNSFTHLHLNLNLTTHLLQKAVGEELRLAWRQRHMLQKGEAAGEALEAPGLRRNPPPAVNTLSLFPRERAGQTGPTQATGGPLHLEYYAATRGAPLAKGLSVRVLETGSRVLLPPTTAASPVFPGHSQATMAALWRTDPQTFLPMPLTLRYLQQEQLVSGEPGAQQTLSPTQSPGSAQAPSGDRLQRRPLGIEEGGPGKTRPDSFLQRFRQTGVAGRGQPSSFSSPDQSGVYNLPTNGPPPSPPGSIWRYLRLVHRLPLHIGGEEGASPVPVGRVPHRREPQFPPADGFQRGASLLQAVPRTGTFPHQRGYTADAALQPIPRRLEEQAIPQRLERRTPPVRLQGLAAPTARTGEGGAVRTTQRHGVQEQLQTPMGQSPGALAVGRIRQPAESTRANPPPRVPPAQRLPRALHRAASQPNGWQGKQAVPPQGASRPWERESPVPGQPVQRKSGGSPIGPVPAALLSHGQKGEGQSSPVGRGIPSVPITYRAEASRVPLLYGSGTELPAAPSGRVPQAQGRSPAGEQPTQPGETAPFPEVQRVPGPKAAGFPQGNPAGQPRRRLGFSAADMVCRQKSQKEATQAKTSPGETEDIAFLRRETSKRETQVQTQSREAAFSIDANPVSASLPLQRGEYPQSIGADVVNQIADRVYQALERRLRTERMRKGLL